MTAVRANGADRRVPLEEAPHGKEVDSLEVLEIAKRFFD